MARGIDYSFSRPSPASIVAAGYTTVGRYLASSTSKRLGAAEAASLQAAGLSIFLVFEDFADPLNNWTGISDYLMGVNDAGIAIGQANALGVPSDRPIYVAVDTAQPIASKDVRYTNYFQGWVDTIGVDRVGMYGGGLLWSYLVGQGVMSSSWFWQAAAASWSNYQVPYPGAVVLQAVGSVLSGTSDEDTTYTNDWGQWPAPTSVPGTPTPPPPPALPPGGTNTANTDVSTAGYAQPAVETLITPNVGHDQVVYAVTVSDATLSTGSHNAFYEIPTPIGQTAYPIGTFSYDGGNTYNDFGFNLAVAPSVAGVYPGVTLQPAVDASGNIFFNGVNNTGSTVDLIINVALLATYNPGLLPAQPRILGGNVSYSNIYPKLTSDATTRVYANYRRIAADSHTGTGASIAVAHGQSTVPNILFWVSVGGFTTINPVGWQSTGSLGALGIRMDGSNLNFHVDGGTYADCYYRVYEDN